MATKDPKTWEQINALATKANNAAKRGDEPRRAFWRAKYEAALAAKMHQPNAPGPGPAQR